MKTDGKMKNTDDTLVRFTEKYRQEPTWNVLIWEDEESRFLRLLLLLLWIWTQLSPSPIRTSFKHNNVKIRQSRDFWDTKIPDLQLRSFHSLCSFPFSPMKPFSLISTTAIGQENRQREKRPHIHIFGLIHRSSQLIILSATWGKFATMVQEMAQL